jgi:hypothetical protein
MATDMLMMLTVGIFWEGTNEQLELTRIVKNDGSATYKAVKKLH